MPECPARFNPLPEVFFESAPMDSQRAFVLSIVVMSMGGFS